MSDEEHSDSEFYYLEEQETQRAKLVTVVGILTKLKQAEILVWKVSSGCIDFRNKKCHIINYLLNGLYSKVSVWYFTVKTSLSVSK